MLVIAHDQRRSSRGHEHAVVHILPNHPDFTKPGVVQGGHVQVEEMWPGQRPLLELHWRPQPTVDWPLPIQYSSF